MTAIRLDGVATASTIKAELAERITALKARGITPGLGTLLVGADPGSLSYVGEEWTRGSYPRSFSFDPTGRFLYCCNQRGDNVACFEVNQKTGRPTFTGRYEPVGNPSHIVFVGGSKD